MQTARHKTVNRSATVQPAAAFQATQSVRSAPSANSLTPSIPGREERTGRLGPGWRSPSTERFRVVPSGVLPTVRFLGGSVEGELVPAVDQSGKQGGKAEHAARPQSAVASEGRSERPPLDSEATAKPAQAVDSAVKEETDAVQAEQQGPEGPATIGGTDQATGQVQAADGSPATGEQGGKEAEGSLAGGEGDGGSAAQGQEVPQAEEVGEGRQEGAAREAVAPAATKDTEPVDAADHPLADFGVVSRGLIDRDSESASRLVRADAASKRQMVSLFCSLHGRAFASFLGAHLQALSFAIQHRQAVAQAWLFARSASVQTFLLTLLARANTAGAMIGGRILASISGLVAGVAAGVNGAIDRVLAMARTIPIPALPGLQRARQAVLTIAARIGAAMRRALVNVQLFVARVIGSVVAAVGVVLARLGRALVGVVTRLTMKLLRLLTRITAILSRLVHRVTLAFRCLGMRVRALLARAESLVIGHISRAEARALATIAANRRRGRATIAQILDFCGRQGDLPADPVADSELAVVENTNAKEQYVSAARSAMFRVVQDVLHRNRECSQRCMQETSSLAGLFRGMVVDFVDRLRQGASRVAQAVIASVGRAVGLVLTGVGTVVDRVRDMARGLMERVGDLLARVVQVVIEVIRHPVANLAGAVRSAVASVYAFLRQFISRLVDLASSLLPGSAGGDDASLTDRLKAFDPARLAAAARMASPPAAAALVLGGIGVVIAEAAAATAALIMTILFWVGVVLLIVLAVVLVVLLVQWIVARVRAMPRAPARAKPRAPSRPRPRRPKKPLRWNPLLSYGKVVASGGLPGTLDTTARLPARAPLHGHHVWPKFVGGPAAQPLMSIRDTVHISFVHPSLNRVLQASAGTMGHTISTHTTDPRNVAFIRHLRRSSRDRATYASVMTTYYAGLNSVTHPAIPAGAYQRGILYSLPRI